MAAGGQVGVDRELARRVSRSSSSRRISAFANGSSARSASGSPLNSASAWRAVSPGAPFAVAASATSRSSRWTSTQLAVDPQLVRAPAGEDLRAAVGAERLAQPPDVVLDHLRGARRGRLAPQALDQPVGRDGPVRLQPEHRQDRALLRSAELERKVVEARLDVSEEPDLHEAGSHALIVQRPGLLVV